MTEISDSDESQASTASASSSSVAGNQRNNMTVDSMQIDSNNVTLWQFLLELLLSDQYRDIIMWTDQAKGEFKLVNPEEVAHQWGLRKNKQNMNYDKLSRALRYYYEKNIIRKVLGQKFVYRFVSFPKVIKTETKIPFHIKMESIAKDGKCSSSSMWPIFNDSAMYVVRPVVVSPSPLKETPTSKCYNNRSKDTLIKCENDNERARRRSKSMSPTSNAEARSSRIRDRSPKMVSIPRFTYCKTSSDCKTPTSLTSSEGMFSDGKSIVNKDLVLSSAICSSSQSASGQDVTAATTTMLTLNLSTPTTPTTTVSRPRPDPLNLGHLSVVNVGPVTSPRTTASFTIQTPLLTMASPLFTHSPFSAFCIASPTSFTASPLPPVASTSAFPFVGLQVPHLPLTTSYNGSRVGSPSLMVYTKKETPS